MECFEKPNKMTKVKSKIIMLIEIISVVALATSGVLSQAHEEVGLLNLSKSKNGSRCYEGMSEDCPGIMFDSFCSDDIRPLKNGCCIYVPLIGDDCFLREMVREAKDKHLCDKKDVRQRAYNVWANCQDPMTYI